MRPRLTARRPLAPLPLLTNPRPSVGKPTDQDISINFADVGLSGSVKVYDIWQNKVVATTTSSYTAKVPSHGTAFLRLSKA